MSKDPHAGREAEKYKNPIPSREFIMAYLNEAGHPVGFDQLTDYLKLTTEEDQTALSFRLKAMMRDGQIMRDRRKRYCLMAKITLLKGKVIGHPDGFGFVAPEDGSADMYLSPREMRKVMHGDQVLARIVGEDRKGRIEAVIHEVVEHRNLNLVGRLHEDQGIFFVEAENKRINQDIMIPPDELNTAKPGQIVIIEITSQPSQRIQPIGRVLEILGDHMAPGMEISVAIRAHELPYQWPEAVTAESNTFAAELTAADLVGRNDLRSKPFVTIDGADAKDFDDAVYCESRPNGGWQLFVAIADVSHYVHPNTALDQEAYHRGTSVYFPGRVIPMLPEILSNGLCSLKPNVDRLTMVAEMTIDETGKLTRYRFYPAVIHSHARMIYDNVYKILWQADKKLRKQYQALVPHLEQLKNLYQVLAQSRRERGAIEFETTETQIEFDQQRKIRKIRPLVRNDAHRLIEECMLMANVATAKFLSKTELTCLYRVHDKPNPERLELLREFLSGLSLNLGGGKKPHTKEFTKILNQLDGRKDAHLIQTVMLRSMSQAQYTEENIGHFGLAYAAYTHFTSPIRRYPDLLAHRAIKHSLEFEDIGHYAYPPQSIHKMGRHCSDTERRADEATRDVISWLKCEYMQDKLGEVFEGVISSVTGFGIFVELSDIYVEGLVHVTSLPGDYYEFDKVRHCLIGQRTRKRYQLGQAMKVRVVRVSLDDRKIDFDLSE